MIGACDWESLRGWGDHLQCVVSRSGREPVDEESRDSADEMRAEPVDVRVKEPVYAKSREPASEDLPLNEQSREVLDEWDL